MSGELRPEALKVSAEAQAFAYERLSDYESNMREFAVHNEGGVSRVQNRTEEILAVMDELEGTDYVYFPTFQRLHNFGGYIVPDEFNELEIMAHDALLAGYNPPQELVQLSRSDFLWDEILNDEHPEYSDVLSRYGLWSGKDNVPDLTEHFNGCIVPRSEVKQMLGALYDKGAECRAFGWGYPCWSVPLEKQLAEITGSAEGSAP